MPFFQPIMLCFKYPYYAFSFPYYALWFYPLCSQKGTFPHIFLLFHGFFYQRYTDK